MGQLLRRDTQTLGKNLAVAGSLIEHEDKVAVFQNVLNLRAVQKVFYILCQSSWDSIPFSETLVYFCCISRRLRLLQEQGYEVKRGKYVSFRAPGQKRFTRCKTLEETYTEEAIIERIKGRFVERKPKENRKISLRIDLENSIKAQQSAGYEKWAKLHNLKQAARTLNFLTEHEIDSYPDLESRVAEITAVSTEAAAALKTAERRLAEMAVLIKDVTTCKELRPLLQEYQRAADKKQFRRKHEGTLILYEAAAKALKEQGFQKLPDLYALKAEYKQLAEQKDQLQRQYNDAKRQMQEYGIIKQNVDGILRTAPGKEQMQER